MNETINPTMTNEAFVSRCQKVLQVARQLYQGKPDWVTFFRETLGVNGAARSVFPDQDEYVRFEQSSEFAEIQKLVANLRTRRIAQGGSKHEPTRVITVRLPESLHEALKAEANDHNTSMNKLCISKLLQVLVDAEKAAQAQSANPTTRPQQPTLPRRSTLPMSPLGLSQPAPAHPNNLHPNNLSMGGSGEPSNPSTLNFRSSFESGNNGLSSAPRYGQT